MIPTNIFLVIIAVFAGAILYWSLKDNVGIADIWGGIKGKFTKAKPAEAPVVPVPGGQA